MKQRKLDKKKLDYYKKSLVKLKDVCSGDITSLSQNPGDGSNDSGDVSGHVMHMADVATDMYDKEFNLGLVSNGREMLYRVCEALKRINDNEFGICSACKKAIPEIRLKAIPYVETCLKCQEKIESEA